MTMLWAEGFKYEPGVPYKRERSIGGSDIGVILGVNPYKSEAELYDEIISGEVVEDGTDATAGCEDSIEEADEEAEGVVEELNGNMLRGKLFEPVAVELYRRETKREVVGQIPRYRPDERPHFHASPDAIIVEPPGIFNQESEAVREANLRALKRLGEYAYRPYEDGAGVLEIKCPTPRNFKLVKNNGVHPMYYAQLQHYLGILDLKWGAFAIFNSLTCELYYFDVERDEPFIAAMHGVATEWWERHVVRGVRPLEVEHAPLEIPWPRARIGGEGKFIDGDTAWSFAMLRLKQSREMEAEARARRRQAEAELKTLMGGEELAVVKGVGRVLWKEGTRASFDRNALRRARPLDYAKVKTLLEGVGNGLLAKSEVEDSLAQCTLDVDSFVKHCITRRFRPTFD